MISPYGVFISYQANVDANGNNIVGDAANECSISVDPTNTSRMAIGWRQFDSVVSNFRQGGWGYTTDAGTTWTFPGVLENNVFRSDPVTNSDEAGTFFYLSLLQTFCENMYRSTNGGQSWTELQADGLAGGGDKDYQEVEQKQVSRYVWRPEQSQGDPRGIEYNDAEIKPRAAHPPFGKARNHQVRGQGDGNQQLRALSAGSQSLLPVSHQENAQKRQEE